MKKIIFAVALFTLISLSLFAVETVLVEPGKITADNRVIEIQKSYYIGKYEVIQSEYNAVTGYNPSAFVANPSNPVEMVTWYDSVMFCNLLSKAENIEPYYDITEIKNDNRNIISANVKILGGIGYRLPSSDEWEFAAKGGNLSNGYIYSGSDDINEAGWYWKNSGDRVLEGGWNRNVILSNNSKSQAVGTKKPNELQIHDMSGNVWEWTETPVDSYRIRRGGSWYSFLYYSETGSLYEGEPDFKSSYIGFRIARGEK